MARDLEGYGPNPPDISWPNQTKVAVNFVLNYEEGAELTPANGDNTCETYGGEFQLSPKGLGQRSLSMESIFEYGSRAGVWRLLRLFQQTNTPLTIFATGLALKLNPALCHYLRHQDHELAGHGWRWIDYATFNRTEEKQHIIDTIKTIEQLTNHRIVGWYTGRKSNHTRRLLKEVGGFLYDSDSYADDLPYLDSDNHLIMPYTLVCNDFRYCTQPGFGDPNDFLQILKNTIDYLLAENRTAVMTVGLHSRISGHPGRCYAVNEFIRYLKTKPNIWVTKRMDIAQFWVDTFS